MSAWKPGDVAVRRSIGGEEQISIVVAQCSMKQHDSGPHFHHAGSGWDSLKSPGAATHGASYRPLVVIDPEDAEQVERLREAWDNVGKVELDSPKPMTMRGYRMRAALREYANPTPRIEEPKGLGAVVELANDERWLHAYCDEGGKQWIDKDGHIADFHEIPAARVLSHGVAPEEAS